MIWARNKRLRIIRKIVHWIQIHQILQTNQIRKGSNLFAIEYLKQHLDKYVRIKHVIEYCDQRTKETTGRSLSDPRRSFKKLRRNLFPNQWSEIQYKQIKYVKFTPYPKSKIISKTTTTTPPMLMETIPISTPIVIPIPIVMETTIPIAATMAPKKKGFLYLLFFHFFF